MIKLRKLLMVLVVTVGLASCSHFGGSVFEHESDEGYKKSPCACFDEFIIMNGKIYKSETV